MVRGLDASSGIRHCHPTKPKIQNHGAFRSCVQDARLSYPLLYGNHTGKKWFATRAMRPTVLRPPDP